MAEENKNNEQQQEQQQEQQEDLKKSEAQKYLDQIENLKKTTVSKADYDRVTAENASLLDQIMNGSTSGSSDQDDEEQEFTDDDIKALRKDLFRQNSGMTNLDYISKALQLRKAMMSKGARDPFLPLNKDYVENDDDKDRCQQIADGLQALVDQSNGNPDAFNANLIAFGKIIENRKV